MALYWLDRVKQSVAAGGTGALTLGSAAAGFQALGAAADGQQIAYSIEDGTAWETGIGTYTHSGTSFARTTRTASSTGAAINVSTAAVFFVDWTAAAVSDASVGAVRQFATLAALNTAVTEQRALITAGIATGAWPNGCHLVVETEPIGSRRIWTLATGGTAAANAAASHARTVHLRGLAKTVTLGSDSNTVTPTIAAPTTLGTDGDMAVDDKGTYYIQVSSVWTTNSSGLAPAPRTVDLLLPNNLLATYSTNVTATGGAIASTTLDKIRLALSELMRNSAWPKIRELWLPMGDTSDATGLATARVKLKYPSGKLAALTNTGFVAGDYTPTGGLIGGGGAGGVAKRLGSDYAPSTSGSTAAENFLAGFCFGAGSRGSTKALVNGSPNGYAGWNASFIGATTSAYFLPNLSNGFGRIGSGQGVTAQGIGRFRAMQQSGGKAEAWIGGFRDAAVTSSSPALSASTVVVGCANGGSATIDSTTYFSGSIGGYAVGDALTQPEMYALAKFFDDANLALGRAVWFDEICGLGDSTTLVYSSPAIGPQPATAASQRWLYKLAADLGMIEMNQGKAGANLASAAGNGTPVTDQVARLFGLSSRINLIGFGKNDVANGYGTSSLVEYDALVAAALQARCMNLGLITSSDVNWTLAQAAYSGTGFANAHTSAEIPAWNTGIKAIAAKYGVPIADIFPVSVLQTDGVHTTAVGTAPTSQTLEYGVIAAMLRAQVL